MKTERFWSNVYLWIEIISFVLSDMSNYKQISHFGSDCQTDLDASIKIYLWELNWLLQAMNSFFQ